MHALYSEDEDVHIESDSHGFYLLALQIKEFVSSGNSKYEIALDQGIDPTPYKHLLNSIVFSASQSNLIFANELNQLHIQGDSKLLTSIAINVTPQNSDPINSKYHIHYDSISFPDLLPDTSLGLIISVCT